MGAIRALTSRPVWSTSLRALLSGAVPGTRGGASNAPPGRQVVSQERGSPGASETAKCPEGDYARELAARWFATASESCGEGPPPPSTRRRSEASFCFMDLFAAAEMAIPDSKRGVRPGRRSGLHTLHVPLWLILFLTGSADGPRLAPIE